MDPLDGRVTEVINRFVIEKPEGVELIPWARVVAQQWQKNGAQFKEDTGYDYPSLAKHLAGLYAETKKRPDAAEVFRFSALSQDAPMPALERAIRESAVSELDMIEPGSLSAVAHQQEINKFLADKGHNTVVHEWIHKQKPMFFAAQKSRAIGSDCTLSDWLETNWRAATGVQRGAV